MPSTATEHKQLAMNLAERSSYENSDPIAAPSGYKGLYAFHKYWGKKPHEPIAYAINLLTKPGQVVVDPFVGSGITGRESLLQSRRFIGVDINPIAVELTRLLIQPPDVKSIKGAALKIQHQVKDEILESYIVEKPDGYASHYLWEHDQLLKVWVLSGRRRMEREPTEHDYALSKSYADYKSVRMRAPQFFSNSRINSHPSMDVNDILAGRAQRNIDLLIDAIGTCSVDTLPALMLCLTAASGQMSKMVFAVTSRGKTTGRVSQRIEVGSWIVGYWRPQLHFEVNVWNCFQRRISKLCKAIAEGDPLSQAIVSNEPSDVIAGRAQASVVLGDCQKMLDDIPNGTVDLLITDPPHSDRIPYLELSEFWNSILGASVNFEDEVVVSNAQERQKTPDAYNDSIREFLGHIPRVLTPQGYFVLIFNARQTNTWSGFHDLTSTLGNDKGMPLSYLGYFPCAYSANSVVQDNRDGSLHTDYAMIFGRSDGNHTHKLSELARIPNWCSDLPDKLYKAVPLE